MTTTTMVASDATAMQATRWRQLIIGIICMVLIANLQYGWTLFVNPINKAHGWSIASIQFAFSIFIALETWLTPIEGWIVDVSARGAGRSSWSLSAASWWRSAGSSIPTPTSLEMLYLGAVLSRHRRRRDLRDLRRPGGEVVSRPARPCGRSDRGGLRRRRGAHRHSDPASDRIERLRGGVLLVRHRPGRIVFRAGLAVAGAGPGETRRCGSAESCAGSDAATRRLQVLEHARCSGCSTSCSSWCRRRA